MLTGLCVLALTGCTDFAKFDYNGAYGTMVKFQEPGAATKTVAVVAASDQRGIKNGANGLTAGDRGSLYLGLIPLFPFGYLEKEEPDNSDDFPTLGRFHFDVQNDLGDAAFASLKASNLFADVTRASAAKKAETDYIWRTNVTSTYYAGFLYSYCVTYIAAPVLWVIGAPCGTSINELWVKFELVDRKSGKTVWTYDYRGRDFITHWIYARIGQDTSLYARLMKAAMNAALYDLNQKLPNL